MTATFSSAMGRGGIVTVMNAKVYTGTTSLVSGWKATGQTPATALSSITTSGTLAATIDHLKFANLNADGPDITITGGQYSNPLIKFGKSMRCEMQAALCQIDALKALGGVEGDATSGYTITDKFPGPVSIIGDTFVVDQATGEQIDVQILIYQFLPDAILSLVQDEATAATFDMNGDVLSVKIASVPGSTFYTILEA